MQEELLPETLRFLDFFFLLYLLHQKSGGPGDLDRLKLTLKSVSYKLTILGWNDSGRACCDSGEASIHALQVRQLEVYIVVCAHDLRNVAQLE